MNHRTGVILVNLSIVVFSSLVIFSCSSMLGVSDDRDFSSDSDFGNNRMPSEAGRCYAKCLMQDEYETYEEDLLVYTGEDLDREGVELDKIIFRPATTKWEKKKAANCQSSDPKDCLIWCLTKVPEVSEEYYVVSDTNLVKDYKIENVSYIEMVKPGGFTEWKEVICEKDISKSLYSNIQLALIEKGFLADTIPDGKIGRSTKMALVEYQKANGLPIGSLDFDTLNHLEVDY